MKADEFDRSYLFCYRASPIRTIDGDTPVILCDCGFDGRHEVHVRLADYNAPERNKTGGEAAWRALDRALMQGDGSTWPLRFVSEQRIRSDDQVPNFERWVGRILVVQPDGELVNVVEVL